MLAESNPSESQRKAEPSPECFPGRFRRTDTEDREKTEFPFPPAMPGAVALLQLLVTSNVADLETIARLIRNDVGLMVQLLGLAFGQVSQRPTSHLRVEEFVVHLGLKKLRAMAARTRVLSCPPGGDADFRACKAFWMHARRAAHTAEELAAGTSATVRDTAYVAGLLCRIGMLPALLDWKVPGIASVNPAEIGSHMLKAWKFPPVLVEIVRGDEQACTSLKARRLLRLIRAADRQASAAESVTVANRTPSWS
jgi:HD-like signal output (HDOD) protein